jgi:hypothetical protein
MSTSSIAARLLANMDRYAQRHVRGKFTEFNAMRAGRKAAEELQKTVVPPERLTDFHPAHAAYVYAQNQVSVLSEQLTELPHMAPFVKIIARAEDHYMPGGPPISPLTGSYFTSWAFFDVGVGPGQETIGTVILAFGAKFGMLRELLHLIRLMQQSRMGLGVSLSQGHWAAQGDATSWLVSETFGLEQARSIPAEQAIEAAEAFMRGEKALPAGLGSRDAIHAALQKLLPAHDPFWPRWLVKSGALSKPIDHMP